MPEKAERLQKILARMGLESRREIERWIEDGRVKLNGKVAKLGDCATSADEVSVDGRVFQVSVGEEEFPTVLIYHKPEGEICTRHDPQQRETVFDHLPHLRYGRWVMVGRLDINSTGLLLFTDNGELANKLMHPSAEIEREYAVRILGTLTPEMIQKLLAGVPLEDGLAKFERISGPTGTGVNQWYNVVLKEGRNREVRRMFEVFDKQVSRLMRVRFGDVHLPKSLKPGEYAELDASAVKRLMAVKPKKRK